MYFEIFSVMNNLLDRRLVFPNKRQPLDLKTSPTRVLLPSMEVLVLLNETFKIFLKGTCTLPLFKFWEMS